MASRRTRRLVTLDDFMATAREAARRVREDGLDAETLIERLAEAAAEKAAEKIASRCRGVDEARIAAIIAEEVGKILEERLEGIAKLVAGLNAEIERLRREVAELRERLSRIDARQPARQAGEPQMPPWARRVARLLETNPLIRLHEAGVDPGLLRANTAVLQKLDAVLVETSRGVYLVRRKEWVSLLERLAGIRTRDEDEALRAAGPLAELVQALLRDNMLYFNNGWRVLRDAVVEPR